MHFSGCHPGLFLDQGNCLTECPDDRPYSYEQSCVSECPKNKPFTHENFCVEECPVDVDDTKNCGNSLSLFSTKPSLLLLVK